MKAIGVGLLLALCTSSASASVWQWTEVYQPLLLDGVVIMRTPYRARVYPCAQEVLMTGWENRLSNNGEWTDQNVVSLFGIGIELVGPKPAGRTPEDFRGLGMHGDTLRVSVDVGALQLPTGWGQPQRREVVEKTVRCVRLNAGKAGSPPRFVDVQIVGAPEYAEFAGTTMVNGGTVARDSAPN